jgi:putative acetyltransferase
MLTKKDSTCDVSVRRFQPGDETAFRSLNERWITHYFKIEPKEQSILNDPQKTVLERGGQILLATVNGQSVGCCALLRINGHEFEVAKMAVAPEFQGRGIGRALLSATIEEARSLGATRLYLETNHILTPAISLYESLGFRHIDPEKIVPSAYARADVYMELFLNP